MALVTIKLVVEAMGTAFDVTVISSLQQLTIQGASVTPGYAITDREDRKFRIHLENCLAAGVSPLSLW